MNSKNVKYLRVDGSDTLVADSRTADARMSPVSRRSSRVRGR